MSEFDCEGLGPVRSFYAKRVVKNDNGLQFK